MKFSKCVLLAAIGPAAAFSPMSRLIAPTTTRTTTTSLNALEDLEAKLLNTPAPAPAPAAKKTYEKPKKEQKPKPEKNKVEKLSTKEFSYPTSAPVPEKKEKMEKPKKEKMEKPKKEKKIAPPSPAVVKKAPPAPAPAPVKVVKKKVEPKPVPPPKPVAKKPPASESDPVLKGVALGAAPLVLAPLVILAGGRDFLTKTAARREAIQEGIAAREAAQAKKKAAAEVDFGGVAGAAVRIA
jgi:hypothetical protein